MGIRFPVPPSFARAHCEENVLFPARKTDRHEETQGSRGQLMEGFEIGHIRTTFGTDLWRRAPKGRYRAAAHHETKISFADEPPAIWILSAEKKVISIFERVNRDLKTTVLMVTHEADFAPGQTSDRLKDGEIEFDRR